MPVGAKRIRDFPTPGGALFRAVALGLAISLCGALPATARDGGILVFAAASLRTALDDVNAQWRKDTGEAARISYAASSALARQIEQGAPADVFISADIDWMDYLAQRRLIRPTTRANLLANRIVLIAPADSTVQLEIEPGFPLAQALGGGRLAMANTSAVPAGKYGKATLEALGVWTSVAADIAQAENVRAALLLVSRGEAPLGIVYRTDAAADPKVRIVDAFAEDSHPPIVYPVAVTAASKNPDAEAFVGYLRSAAAQPHFEKQGFTVLN